MVKDNRIQTYRFATSSLIANADGNIDIYTSYPLNGNLKSIQNIAGNQTATGSLVFSLSGTGETIFSLISGANCVSVNFTTYPRAPASNTSNVSIGSAVGDFYVEIPLDTVIRVVGSGLGNLKSGLGLNITYQ